MIPSLAGMTPVDYTRYITITIAFLVASFSKEMVFLRADVVCCVGMGVGWLVFPDTFLEFQISGPRNPAHVVFGRLMGLCFLGYALPIILNRRTRDDKVFTAIYMSRLLGFGAMMISLLGSHLTQSASDVRLTSRQFWFNAVAIGGWMLGNFRHLLVSGGSSNSSERNPENRLRYYQFLDTFLSTASLFILAYPSQGFSDLNIKVSPNDGFLVYAVRVQAALFLAETFYGLCAYNFGDVEAVKNVFKLKILGLGLYSLMYIISGIFLPGFIVVMLLIYAVVIVNSVLAIRFIDSQTAKSE